MLHQHHATFYSYFDELASMDQEMYKSLNFVKVILFTMQFCLCLVCKQYVKNVESDIICAHLFSWV